MTEEDYSWMEDLSWNDLRKALIESYNTSEKQRNKLEAVREWAFWMSAMYEDCTYMSHEAFERDAKKHLEKLVTLVGKWIPPEIREEAKTQ